MSLTNQNNEQLLLLCSKGNQLAQLEVYNRYYRAMYNTAVRIVKDAYKAEDIMQESFLMAFTKLDTLKDKKVFGSWLKRIVINNSIADYNKMITEKSVPLESIAYKLEDDVKEEKSNTATPEVKRILKGLNKLKPNYNLCLTLHFIEGYDYEEIGEIMNISYGNCRTMMSRAKESLRQKLMPLKTN